MNEGCGPPRPAPPQQSSPSWPAPTPSLERHNLPGSGCLWRLCTCYFLCQKVLPDPSMACSLQVTSSGKPRLASVCPPRPPALTPRWSQPSLPPALGYSCVFLCFASFLSACPPGCELPGQPLGGAPLAASHAAAHSASVRGCWPGPWQVPQGWSGASGRPGRGRPGTDNFIVWFF